MSRRSVFASLCSMVFLVNLARISFAPLLEPLKDAFLVGDAAVGLLATLAWLGSAAPRLPVGWLLTRFRREHVVLGAGTVLTGAALVAASAPSMPVLFGAAFLLGLSSGAYFIAANPLVSELFPERVGAALGAHGAASQLAAVGAAPLVGVALSLGSWRITFRALAAVGALATVALFLIARRTTLPEAGREDRDLLGAVRAQWRLILTGVAIIGAIGFVWNGTFNFYVTYLGTKGIAEPPARDLLTVAFAAGLPAMIVSGRLADRVPEVPYLLALCGAFGAGLYGLTVAEGYAALLVVSAALGLPFFAAIPAIDTYMLSSLPDGHRASAYSAYSASMMLVMAAGSVTVGVLRGQGVAFDALFRTGVGLVVAIALVLAALYALGRLPTGARSYPEGRPDAERF